MPETQKLFYLHFLLLSNLYYIIVTTRFRLIKNTIRHLLPKGYINPNDFLPEPSYSGKIKLRVRKVTATFGLLNCATQQISELVTKKKKVEIGNIFGSRSIVIIGKAIEILDDPKVWLETDNYILTVKEKKILLSNTEWRNDNIMDVAQKLFCKAIGRLESYQLVLNWQKRETSFFNISEEHIQLIQNGANDWLMSFSSNDRV